ncbi:mucin-1-like isoform X1 [Homarus americanus]|uniref:mucin-1-like isoform X1 n=1 Tax=Homarus americanus TaxID=6706 RepID=UPI001C46369E|nr:mucin-1-like isoform X1 [Homarus americanus]
MSGLLSIGSRAASVRRHHRQHLASSSSAHSSPTHSPSSSRASLTHSLSSARVSPTYLSPGETILPPTRSAPTTPGHATTSRTFSSQQRPDQLGFLAPPEPSQGARSVPTSPLTNLRRQNSPSRSPSPSARESRKPSPSARESRTPSPSARGSRTPSPSARGSRTPSPSAKGSRTPSPSARGSRTPSPSARGSRTPSPSAKGSRTLSPSARRSRTPSPSARGSRTPSPSEKGSRTPSLSPKRSRTASPYRRRSFTPSPEESSSPTLFSPSPKGSSTPSPSLKGSRTPSLSLRGSRTHTPSLRGSSATTPLTPAVPSSSASYSTFDFDSLPWGLSHVNHQVSVDDRRQLFSAGKLNVESGMSAYGSIAYQMRDANMDSNNTCEFVYKALKVISKTVLMTVLLVISITVPVLMVIMGVQYLNDCPLEPNIPIYLLVGGCFGTLKLLWMLCQQVRSRRYERIDDAFAEDSLDEIFTSTSYRATDVALTIFLLIWFGMGNYWVYKIYLPNFHVTLFQPNDWCSKTVYLFAVAQLFFVYAIVGFFIVVAFCLACGQKCVMLFGESYK